MAGRRSGRASPCDFSNLRIHIECSVELPIGTGIRAATNCQDVPLSAPLSRRGRAAIMAAMVVCRRSGGSRLISSALLDVTALAHKSATVIFRRKIGLSGAAALAARALVAPRPTATAQPPRPADALERFHSGRYLAAHGIAGAAAAGRNRDRLSQAEVSGARAAGLRERRIGSRLCRHPGRSDHGISERPAFDPGQGVSRPARGRCAAGRRQWNVRPGLPSQVS